MQPRISQPYDGNMRNPLSVPHFCFFVTSVPIMRTPGTLLGCFYAPVLCLFWLTKHAVDSVKLSAPEAVTAAKGGSVTVSCQYDHQYREHTKYWCKGPIYKLCAIVVKTPRHRPSDRCFIEDDKEAGVFTVTMTSLTESDENKYWCVIARSGKNIFAGVRLHVSHTVTTTTITPTTSLLVPQDVISWWEILRWILFILMLCCLASTHIVVWRIKTASKICPHQQLDQQNSNIYD